MAASHLAAAKVLADASSNNRRFSREARLLDAQAYSQVFKKNKRLSSPYWIVLAHRHTGNPGRLGLAIAKKRAKRAVDRNRLKRIARESFRHQLVALHGIDAVVMNKDGATRASSSQLRQSLDKIWNELSVGQTKPR